MIFGFDKKKNRNDDLSNEEIKTIIETSLASDILPVNLTTNREKLLKTKPKTN